jgi:hypothetical protein
MGIKSNDSRTDTPVPFFVGVPRSGTTPLRAMLASHSYLSVPDEAGFLLSMSRRPSRYERSNRLELEAFLIDLLEDPDFQSWSVSEQEAPTAL